MDVYKHFYMLGVRIRNDKIMDCYNKLKDSETWCLDKLKDNQLHRLQEILSIAYNGSTFYRDKFDNAGIKPSDIKTLEDLSRIPVTTKEEVLAASTSIQIPCTNEKLYYSETSGSTGTPLVFYRNQEWDAWHNASVMRGYSWHGVNMWEKNGYLWGYNIAPKKRFKVKWLDFIQNRFRLFSYQDDEIEAFIRKMKDAEYLSGYSSMLFEVAKKVNTRTTPHKFSLKMIKGTSEKIFDSYQIEVEKAFGRKIISEYGSAEGGIIAFECPCGKMHVNMETVIVEEENGEVLLTNLVSKSFPIIRYKIGDYIVLGGSEQCGCGIVHETIDEVTGRVGAVIYGHNNTYPSLTLYYVFKNLASECSLILNYQAVQENKGILEVNIESKLSDIEAKKLNAEFIKYFNNDVEIRLFDNVKRDDFKAKKKDFISKIVN
jgi:phenylacetate-CoA ligase